jgi:hypothetical protein
VCRLALTLNGATELLNHCRQLTVALEKAGLLTKTATGKVPVAKAD